MLHRAEELEGFTINAEDGELGKIEDVSWAEGTVGVDMKTKIIENAPEYDPSEPIDREYENKLFEYYGRAKYWLNTKL